MRVNYLGIESTIILRGSDVTLAGSVVLEGHLYSEPVYTNIFCNHDPGIQVMNVAYNDLNSSEKYDLVVSILGADINSVNELLDCISRNATNDAIVILCLRISSDLDLLRVAEKANDIGLNILTNYLYKVRTPNESFPILALIKSKRQELSIGDKIRITRKGYHDLPEFKRTVGFEAENTYELIKEGELIMSEKKTYSNATATLRYISLRGVVYRVWNNTSGNFVVEYPISKKGLKINIEDYNTSIGLEKDFYRNSL